MVNKTITDLNALVAAVASGDLLEFVDISDTTDSVDGSSFKVTGSQLRTYMLPTTEETQDAAWAAVSSGTQTLITVTYQDGTNDVDFIVDNDLANYSNATSAFITGISGLAPDTATTAAAQPNITSLGTLTSLQVDNININGNTISSTAGVNLNITPLAGQQLVLDGTIIIDAGVITGGTSITSTSFVGALTGNADTVTTNANLTGEITSSGNSATLDVTAISGQTLVTAVATDMILIEDATDGALKRVDAGDFLAGSGDMVLADVQTVTGAKTFNSGTFKIAGSTSGTTIVNATAIASGTIIIPAATDTLVGKATTDTFTNKSGNISQWTNDSGYITATLTQEEVEDFAGNMIAAGGTKTLITVTYQDGTNDMDFVVDNDLANYDNTTSDFLATTGSAQNLTLANISGSTYTTVQHMQDIFHSAGWVSGGAISDAGSNTINVDAGTGFTRATDSSVAEILFFDWSASNGLSVPSGATRWVGIEYNAGTPQVVVKTTDSWDYNTDFLIGTVVNEGGTIHIENSPHAVGDHAHGMLQRIHQVQGMQRDNELGGIILGETGTRNITLSAGATWDRITRNVIPAIDTSVAGTFDRYYSDGASGYTRQASQTQWNNTQYDDGSGTLATLSNNRWANHWWYISLDGALMCMFGTAQYTSKGAAEMEAVPTSIPDRIRELGLLIGRTISQKSASTLASIESAFDVTFSGALVTDHGNLAGLSDDDHTQYSLISSQAGVPSSTPTRVGEVNIDTTNNRAYVSTGTASSADWDIMVSSASTDTLTNKTLGSSTTFSVAPTINDGIKFTFNPNASTSGINAGAHTAEPSSPVNGDIFYDSTANQMKGYVNGAWVNLGAGAGGGLDNIVEDLTPQLGGDLDLNSKGVTEELTAAVSLVAGDLCYMNSSGKFDKADADAEATADTMLALCLDTISADAVGTFLLYGRWTTTGLTAGSNYYVSTTAAGITATAPSAAADIVRLVGTALSTTVLFFNPDSTYIEIA